MGLPFSSLDHGKAFFTAHNCKDPAATATWQMCSHTIHLNFCARILRPRCWMYLGCKESVELQIWASPDHINRHQPSQEIKSRWDQGRYPPSTITFKGRFWDSGSELRKAASFGDGCMAFRCCLDCTEPGLFDYINSCEVRLQVVLCGGGSSSDWQEHPELPCIF